MVEHNETPVGSSNAITVYVGTVKHSRQQPHEAFANLRDAPAAVEQFSRTWGLISNLPMVEANKLGYRDLLRQAWQGDPAALRNLQQTVSKYVQTDLTVAANGRVEMKADQLLGTIVLLFLCDHLKGRTAFCANPECTQPYFIKERASRKFCEDPKCSAFAQRQYALKWWNEEGKQQRERRRKKSRAKRRK